MKGRQVHYNIGEVRRSMISGLAVGFSEAMRGLANGRRTEAENNYFLYINFHRCFREVCPSQRWDTELLIVCGIKSTDPHLNTLLSRRCSDIILLDAGNVFYLKFSITSV